MRKIISLFQRNYASDRLVRDEVVPGAEWVINGEGVATRKYDGTACMVRGGKLFKRYDRKKKKGKYKDAPEGWEPCETKPDKNTGHWPGWVPVRESPDDKHHREAWNNHGKNLPDGTYELCGPAIQNNPENYEHHFLILHVNTVLDDVPRDYEGIKEYLRTRNIEGIVWHHLDGRMVKIKRKDFFKKVK